MSWKLELKHILEAGCTDSDIEDFIGTHPKINGKEIWDFVCEYDAPVQCKGCKHIQMRGFSFPCNKCSRSVKLDDYYEKR